MKEVRKLPRARDPNREKAYQIYKDNNGKIDLVEIASQLNLSAGTIRGWKSKDKWEQKINGTLQKNTERSKRKRGGQPGNHNATGPPNIKNAETHGFFSKYLPEETFSIIQEIEHKNPLDILWENIQIAYAAIVRAQKIAYVKDKEDNTIIQSGYKNGNVIGADYLVQTALDRQAKFMQAQSRAQGQLRSLIDQYDKMLHNNWELATEEQKARIAKLKADVDKNEDKDKPIKIQFVKASEQHGKS